MHPSRIETKTSWKHIKILSTKPLEHFMNKDEKILVYHVWHEII
jgi:hypothetical protein